MFAAVLVILSTHQLQTLEFWARLLRRQALGLLLSGVNILETNQLSFSSRGYLRAAQPGGTNRRLEFGRE